MAKSLVIVESPAKAKTIQKYLGAGFTVKASMGHVRDLPAKEMGVDIEHGFVPTYKVLAGRAATIKQLKSAAKDVDKIYLAPDPDREGEAIAWHITEALKLSEEKTFRVTFNEITKRAIVEAFKNPCKIDMAKVYAQQARRVLDRIVGYQLSPLLWKKVAKGLSAGRVQSVAVRLIVEREKEIAAFKVEEYWKITVKLAPAGGEQVFTAELTKLDGKEFKPARGEEAEAVATALRKAQYQVAAVERKQQKASPPPPFDTSLLQQQASVLLHFTTRRTMRIAQQLYEGVEVGPEGSVGLITYMRTDSYRVSQDAINECRDFVKEKFGERYVSERVRVYKAGKSAQEAHEAVRPTSVHRTPESLKQFLTPEQFRLYQLIWNRFVATQMADALYDVTRVDITAANGLFRVSGRVCRFDGHTRISAHEDRDMQELPPLEVGQKLDLKELVPSQHFTKPPARYTEASLVRVLKHEGIGRPSTYSTIISTIQDRGYVRQEKRVFHATELGITVTDLLLVSFPKLMDVQFTSGMEERLDKIEEEHTDWVSVLGEFYKVFKENLDTAATEMKRVKGTVVEGEVCPTCGKPMLERWSKFGKFMGCSGYPKCKYIKGGAASGDEAPEIEVKCEKCGKPMVIKNSRRGKFMGCSGYPECRNTLKIDATGKPLPPPVPTDEKCEKCGSMMVIRTNARGRFLACSAFPKCRNIKSMATETPCPREGCDGKLIYRRGRGRKKGFYACTKYPECDFTASEMLAKE